VGIWDALGVRPVINVAGPQTRLSGGPLHPDVIRAMAEAAGECARIEDLQEAAGRQLANITGAEAGYVTAGAAAGLTLSAAACIAGLNVAAMDKLPDTKGLANEIIIQRAHVTAYSHALRVAGATLVEVGYVGYPGQGITWPWQIESAITDRTVAVAYSIGSSKGIVSLEDVVSVAHSHELPVIVDAAASLPPVENLRRFIAAGADLVTYSGGKAIGGPQASGILVGRSDLISSVALQHQDMDVYPETWTWRDRYITNAVLPGPPHHGLGRSMKVGKEEIVGLVTALERFVNRDHDAERRDQEKSLMAILSGVEGLPGVEGKILSLEESPRAYATAVVYLDEDILGRSVADVVNALIEGDPPVAVSQNFMDQSGLGIVATTLREGDEKLVTDRLREVLA
jgi:D-glucosaminate-6-phosphate ammonia-lyase